MKQTVPQTQDVPKGAKIVNYKSSRLETAIKATKKNTLHDRL